MNPNMMTPLVERAATDDHRYRMAVCTSHKPKKDPQTGSVECAWPWCRASLESEHAVENPRAGLRQLLASVVESREWQMRRLVASLRDPSAASSLLPEKGVQAFDYDPRSGLLQANLGLNRVTISGRRIAGRSTFDITGEAAPAQAAFTGIDNNVTNPVDTTDALDATAGNRSIKALDSGFATITAAAVSPVKVTTQSTWTEVDNPGPKTFLVKRIGLLNASSNAAETLYSLLGGTTPTSILNLDFTGLATFTLKLQVEITLSNQSAQ